MPDWHYVDGINPEQAHHLILLDEYRESQPVAWALIKGLHTSESISKLIGWPHEWVLGKLRLLKNEGLVWDSEGRASVIWNMTGDARDWWDMKTWYDAQLRPGGLFRRNENSQE